MSKIITDADLDRATQAVRDLSYDAELGKEGERIAIIALARDLWGTEVGIEMAEHYGMTYQPSPAE